MINIVIPMAGRGSRFAQKGYTLPKPLIGVHDIPMIRLVIQNLTPNENHRFIFLALKEHIDQYGLNEKLKEWAGNQSIIVPVTAVTEGAACTVLLAKEYINNQDQLMIANSDQWIDFDINDYLKKMSSDKLDGLIMTMFADDPKWSFVRMSGPLVTEVAEKKVISNEATVGIYNFKHGSDFVQYAEQMIDKNLRVNNEFYVAPVYNELVEKGQKISIYNIGAEFDGMYGLGIPDDLNKFLASNISQKAIERISR